MLQMLEKGRAGEPVNICNQKAHTIQEVLDILVEESGVDVDVEQDPALLRPFRRIPAPERQLPAPCPGLGTALHLPRNSPDRLRRLAGPHT